MPQAAQLARLGVTRGATALPELPGARPFYQTASVSKRTRPRSVADGTMPEEVAAAIQERITNDDPDGARFLLDGTNEIEGSKPDFEVPMNGDNGRFAAALRRALGGSL